MKILNIPIHCLMFWDNHESLLSSLWFFSFISRVSTKIQRSLTTRHFCVILSRSTTSGHLIACVYASYTPLHSCRSNTPVFNPFFDCPLVLRASAIVLFHRLYLTYLAHTFCIFFFEPHFWRASFSRWNAATVRSFANRACIHLSITSKSITG